MQKLMAVLKSTSLIDIDIGFELSVSNKLLRCLYFKPETQTNVKFLEYGVTNDTGQ